MYHIIVIYASVLSVLVQGLKLHWPVSSFSVSLSSKSDYFEGFMLQANEVGSTVPIGTFSVLNSSAQAIYCNTDAVSFSTLFFLLYYFLPLLIIIN